MFITDYCTHYRRVQRIHNIKTRLSAGYLACVVDICNGEGSMMMTLMFFRGKSTCAWLCKLGFGVQVRILTASQLYSHLIHNI
jgi:hypothetical protein